MICRPGQAAPEFSLPDEYGGTFSLAEARTSAPVLLVFYPFAFSPVCGAELRELERLRTASPAAPGAVPRIAAVSTDSKYTLAAWAAERGTGFDLLSDFWPHGAVARAYGVFDEDRGMARRGTFLIDTDGRLVRSALGALGEVRDFSDWLTPGRAGGPGAAAAGNRTITQGETR